jgi:hypothetical protein
MGNGYKGKTKSEGKGGVWEVGISEDHGWEQGRSLGSRYKGRPEVRAMGEIEKWEQVRTSGESKGIWHVGIS